MAKATQVLKVRWYVALPALSTHSEYYLSLCCISWEKEIRYIKKKKLEILYGIIICIMV